MISDKSDNQTYRFKLNYFFSLEYIGTPVIEMIIEISRRNFSPLVVKERSPSCFMMLYTLFLYFPFSPTARRVKITSKG